MDMLEHESRINQLTGNMMGVQMLLLSVVANSGRRVEIANHLQEEARRTLATMNGESALPDEVLHHLENWLTTTVDMLLSDEAI